MPFTWRESQDAFGACAAEHVDPDVYSSNRKRWVLWHSSSAIGNALNVFVQTFLYALISGRNLAVGHGRVPELMCGPHGAFRCGVPHWESIWESGDALKRATKVSAGNWEKTWDADHEIHEGHAAWYQYRSSFAVIGRGDGGPAGAARRPDAREAREKRVR